MTERPTVVGLAGSLRDESRTRIAVDHALSAAASAGATTEHLDLRALDLPVYDADADGAGDSPTLVAALRDADAVVIGTPMYHGSYSSVVKTALDYCSIEALSGTTVGLVTVSGGGFPTPALEHLRASCLALETEPVPNQVAIPDSWDRIEDGTVTDDDIAERLATLGRDVVRHATSERHTATAEAGVSADD